MEEKQDLVAEFAEATLAAIQDNRLDVAEVLQKVKLLASGRVNEALHEAQAEVDRLRSLKMRLDRI